MLGFILSKLNLLILVVAMFAIIAYFTFSLADVVEIQESQRLLDRLSRTSSSMVNSPSYCDSLAFNFRESLEILGKPVFYRVRVGYQDIAAGDEDVTFIIFSFYPARSDRAIAAESFKTDAKVFLYDSDFQQANNVDDSSGWIEIEPSSVPPTNSLIVVKQIVEGEQELHFIPCLAGQTCESARTTEVEDLRC